VARLAFVIVPERFGVSYQGLGLCNEFFGLMKEFRASLALIPQELTYEHRRLLKVARFVYTPGYHPLTHCCTPREVQRAKLDARTKGGFVSPFQSGQRSTKRLFRCDLCRVESERNGLDHAAKPNTVNSWRGMARALPRGCLLVRLRVTNLTIVAAENQSYDKQCDRGQ
jgi:hypothetical protein